MTPKKRGAVSLVLVTPGLLLLSGCNGSNRNCDSNRSTPQTSDDCGTGSSRSNRSRGFVGGGIFRGGGSSGDSSSAGSGSLRGGFGSSGRSFGGGSFGGGG